MNNEWNINQNLQARLKYEVKLINNLRFVYTILMLHAVFNPHVYCKAYNIFDKTSFPIPYMRVLNRNTLCLYRHSFHSFLFSILANYFLFINLNNPFFLYFLYTPILCFIILSFLCPLFHILLLSFSYLLVPSSINKKIWYERQ